MDNERCCGTESAHFRKERICATSAMYERMKSGRSSPRGSTLTFRRAGDKRELISRSRQPKLGKSYGAGVIAVLSAVVVYFVATSSEILAIRLLQPTEMELTWISDAILAAAFGLATFLWLHLKVTRRALSRLEREHIVIDTQLGLAADIQRGLLPRLPSADDGVRWAARLQQAGRIGGDLYDFVRHGSGSWLVLVGDVSGKGIPAALVLASIRTMFRMIAEETGDPGELVERISHSLYEDNGGRPYLTCLIARIDVDKHEMAYVNAGHPPGLVLEGSRPGQHRWLLDSNGPPAGMFPDQEYQATSLALPRRAVSIFVTDGITDAFDELGLSGTDPIASLIAQMTDPPAPDRICDALIDRTAPALASDGSGWQDDRTVVAFVLDE
jgi:stage II sporulation SpoE-like protein